MDQILQAICLSQHRMLHSSKTVMQFSAVYVVLFDTGHQFKRDFRDRQKDAKVLSSVSIGTARAKKGAIVLGFLFSSVFDIALDCQRRK